VHVHFFSLNAIKEILTHFISMAVKMGPVMSILRGIVRIRTKGRASENELDFTAHRITKHITWIKVYRCIRIVGTCRETERERERERERDL